ncbi:Tm-1-like ATP-binding domain-containing protein [Luxibacter massiliensis]|uniref:Tm-1-like ATP-binding domain-containing protein n=1 Tax=Luxibacter massiliensis TaxID=2219695 RepID=UPI000F04A181|nr:Tm-1-like ATP-binding domain-containing protein [Luxibacter massiliensis]
MKPTVAVLGTFDTKGEEFCYLIQCLESFHMAVITVDLGTREQRYIPAHYRAAEGISLGQAGELSKDQWMKAMAASGAKTVQDLLREKRIQGIISMGGGQGTFLANQIFRELPLGMPKLLLSTLALLKDSASQFTGLNDTLVMNSLVDISGLNTILKDNIQRAAGALAGMLSFKVQAKNKEKKRAVGISCWGVTTPCVDVVRKTLEMRGYEVYVFHANGEGGTMLERFVREGFLDGVVDVTLSEVSMPLAGSYQEPVRGRLESSGSRRVPRVVAPGGLDMVLRHKGEAEGIVGRKVYFHTPDVVFVRSNIEENRLFASVISEKLNQCEGPVALMLPLKGISKVDVLGEIFFEPETDAVLFGMLKHCVSDKVEIIEMDCDINHPAFGEKAAQVLIDKIEGGEK